MKHLTGIKQRCRGPKMIPLSKIVTLLADTTSATSFHSLQKYFILTVEDSCVFWLVKNASKTDYNSAMPFGFVFVKLKHW